jgi:hypothetical protein
MNNIASLASPVNPRIANSHRTQPDPSTGSGRGLGVPAGPVTGEAGPLVSCPYGHIPHKQRASGRPKKPPLTSDSMAAPVFVPSRLSVWPDGFEITPDKILTGEQPEHLKEALRGEIKGFSAKAAGRLRQWLVENWAGSVSRRNPFAVTLTARTDFTPEQWRSVVKRFRQTLSRKCPDWAWCWRVELQKRGTPHLHCIAWGPAAPAPVVLASVRCWWLAATGEAEDTASQKFAVMLRDIDGGQASGWLVYCALHNGKSNGAQLGWKGKQWGLWNNSAWAPRPASARGNLPLASRVQFLRRLRRWSRGRNGRAKPLASPWRVQSHHTVRRCLNQSTVGQLLRGLNGTQE